MARIFNMAAVTVALGAVLYTAGGYVAVPYLVKTSLERGVGHSLNRTVRITHVTFNPWTWLLEIQGLEIAAITPDALPLLRVPLLRLDVSSQSVRHLSPVLDEVTIDGLKAEVPLSDPDIRAWLHPEKNDDAVLTPTKSTTKSWPDFALYNIAVKNAMVHFTDKANGLDQSITDFNLTLPFVSTLPGVQESLVTPSLSFNLNGSTIYATGSTKPFGTTLEARLNFRIKDLDVTSFTKLVPALNNPAFKLTNGRLSTDMTFIFRNPTGGNPGKLLLNGTAQLRNLAATQTNGNRTDNFLTVGNTALKIKQLDVIERNADIESFSLDNVRMTVPTDSVLLSNTSNSVSASSESVQSLPSNADTSLGDWHWHIGELRLGKAQLDFVNPAIRKLPTISLTDVNATLAELSNATNSEPATLAFSSKLLGGEITANGKLTAQNWSGDIAVNARQINFAPTSPFIQTMMRGSVAGTLASSLQIVLQDGVPSLSGNAALTGFTIKQGRDVVLALKEANALIDKVSFDQRRATLKNLRLDSPALALTVYRSGLNLNSLFSPLLERSNAAGSESGKEETSSTGTSTSNNWRWLINELQLVNGSVRYADQSARPTVAFSVTPLNVSAKALGTAATAPSPLTFSTTLAQGKISGEGTFDARDNSFESNLKLEAVQLKELSSFFVREAGFGVRSGSLTALGQLRLQQREGVTKSAVKGDMMLTELSLTTPRNTLLGGWSSGYFKGIDFSRSGAQPDVRISRIEIEQPQVKETRRAQQAVSIVTLLAKATGHEKTAQRLEKVDQAFSRKLILENVSYQDGRFAAKGLDAQSVTGIIFEKIANALKK